MIVLVINLVSIRNCCSAQALELPSDHGVVQMQQKSQLHHHDCLLGFTSIQKRLYVSVPLTMGLAVLNKMRHCSLDSVQHMMLRQDWWHLVTVLTSNLITINCSSLNTFSFHKIYHF